MHQKSPLQPIADHISEEIRQTVSYPLKNLRVFLRKETKKGLYTTIIDLCGQKEGKIVAKKTDSSLEKSVQKAKNAIYRQIIKHHEIHQRKKHSPHRELIFES